MRAVKAVFFAAVFGCVAGAATAEGALTWHKWSDGIFQKAKAEQRFVILDLEAVWCHWCHVMERTTYQDPKVVELLKAKYLPVRVDQDANPDLSNRYGDWGWPATIVFAADGTELVKLRGYIPPERMASLLAAIIDDPTPGPSVSRQEDIRPSATAFLTAEQRQDLQRRSVESFDTKNGGWGSLHKYIDTDSMDLALAGAEKGDAQSMTMVRKTLGAAMALIDRQGGGVYQYSDKDDWSSPHYEKIMWYQAQYLRQYSQAYALLREPDYLTAARDIARYLTGPLSSPEGAFFTSQDADASEAVPGKVFYAMSAGDRLKLGLQPRIDTNIYARENGWAVSGLIALYNVTNEPQLLERAERAARWVVANRLIEGGGFKHGESDRGGPFLGDTLAMAQAALDLYAATGSREWLPVALRAGDFIAQTFRDERGGYFTSKRPEAAVGVLSVPVKQLDEQIALARFFIELHHTSGRGDDRQSAEHALRYITAEAVLASGRPLPGVLLADAEAAAEPTHITIVGRKDDPDARLLHAAARRFPAFYKRLDWWDTREGPLPNPDVTYPELERAAAFACTNRVCSLPAFDADELVATVTRITKLSPPEAVR